VRSEFAEVGKAVAVQITGCVIYHRVRPVGDFPAVRHAVVVGVGGVRIGAGCQFLGVGQAVAIGVQAGVGH